MKRKVNKSCGIYAYLEASGVLEQTPEAIENARRAYWAEYKRKWKQAKFKQEKRFTVSFTASELKVLTEAANMHNMSRSRFIKQACLAYAQKKYLVPNTQVLHQVKALLSLNYSALQALFDENLVPYAVGIDVMKRMERLEREIEAQVTQPKLAH